MKKDIVVEVGLKLDKDLDYYHDMLIEHGAINVYNCETRDIYWSNKKFDGMSENEIKKACVRFRYCNGFGGTLYNYEEIARSGFQNYSVFDNLSEDSFMCTIDNIYDIEKKLEQNGWNKKFDTKKKDYQYVIGNMKSRIQLQKIENIGLLVYYDNPDYYNLPVEKQRIALIDELNSYGFEFDYKELGLDKLRTLYYKKDCFSDNQNG